ncbi:MAG: polysaccharide export protein [Microcystis viridis Mv_BB_P_19951000_S69D]|nr:MAG: polysaccharide export protein [Microcystis viridis Mv_BB_P_19951000_S69D]
MQKTLFFTAVALAALWMVGCNSARRLDRNYNLFQRNLDSVAIRPLQNPVIQPNDQLNITVYSATLNQEQAALFNMANTAGSNGTVAGSTSAAGYFVDLDGNIQMPVIGVVKAAGLTIPVLRDTLQARLSPYVMNPVVLIKFNQFKVSVMGEVNTPGIKTFPSGIATILDAINTSGGLKDEGRRDSIVLIRQDSGRIQHYNFDLRSVQNTFASPEYQLRQNDIVYVKANDQKLRTLKQNPNTLRTITIISTVASLILITLTLYRTF